MYYTPKKTKTGMSKKKCQVTGRHKWRVEKLQHAAEEKQKIETCRCIDCGEVAVFKSRLL